MDWLRDNDGNPPLNRSLAALRGAAAMAALLSTGCLYTTHHFNTGRILEPGRTAVTFGTGTSSIYSQVCPEGYGPAPEDTTGTRCAPEHGMYSNRPIGDTVRVGEEITKVVIPKFSLDYRLGVRGPWGLFTGVEMGWHVEAVTNPATVEFDLKFGLPIPKRLSSQHSLSGGWGVGMWADNSWFLEYAASRDFGKHALYGNYRHTWLATQPTDIDKSFENWKFTSHRSYADQAALGLFLRLPEWSIIPDYVSPQFNITFPVTPPFAKLDRDLMEAYLLNFNFGFGWNF
jgi:hypothetical protein